MTDYYNDKIACLIKKNKNMSQERRYHYTNSLLLPTDNQLLAKIAGNIPPIPPDDSTVSSIPGRRGGRSAKPKATAAPTAAPKAAPTSAPRAAPRAAPKLNLKGNLLPADESAFQDFINQFKYNQPSGGQKKKSSRSQKSSRPNKDPRRDEMRRRR